MDEQDIIRDVCVAIPLCCPHCHQRFRWDRIKLTGKERGAWYINALCGDCNRPYQLVLTKNFPRIREAFFAVLGERSIKEEIRLRSEPISPDYEEQLPDVLGGLWVNGPEEEPNQPLEPA